MHSLKPIILLFCLSISACMPRLATMGTDPATAPEISKNKRELLSLPKPKGKISVAVYSFRDQTGQYKPVPNVSSFSTAVTQGTTTMLTQALKESNWFVPMEREGLQNLLTERKIIRATLEKQGVDIDKALPPLENVSILIEGGVVGYDTNLVTGGLGAKYFGLGASTQYRMDQVSVSLRAVDVRTGRILKSLGTTKSILSREVSAGLFRFVSFKRLLEAEMGVTTNEPVQVAVMAAIEKAVVSLVIEGIMEKLWELENPKDYDSEIIKNYIADTQGG